MDSGDNRVLRLKFGELRRDQAQHDLLSVRDLREGLEAASAVGVVLKIIGVYMFLFKQELRDLVREYPESDVSKLAGTIVNGLDSGRSFAGTGYNPGSLWDQRSQMADSIADGDTESATLSAERETSFVILIAAPRDSIDIDHLLYGIAHYNFTNFYIRSFEMEKVVDTHLTQLRIKGFRSYDDGFARLFAEFANRRPGFDEACAALLSGILVELARGVDRAAAGPMRKLESVAYLHSHYREEVRVAELAAMEHLSESRYRAVFHQQMGTSPLDYRTALRLQHACQLLALTNRSVTEIAAECGYADPLYFMRLFHQKKQMPPGEFRARAQKNAED